MIPVRLSATAFAVAALVLAAVPAGVPAQSARVSKPVIGPPTATPSSPTAGKRFTVTFRVTRSDTRAALTSGRMVCDPTVGGKVVPHAESFVHGVARLSLLVPVAAQGRTLEVRLTIRYAGSDATRITRFRVPPLPKPSLSVGDAAVVEGNGGTAALVFPVTLSAATPLPVTAAYATVDGTATAPGDYTSTSGTLLFRPGQTRLAVTVPVVGDLDVEADETLTLAISSAANAVVLDGQGTGTITTDDVAARSGHYTGSTSQWQFIAFDVGDGARSISGLFLWADLTCDTPLGSLKGMKFELLETIPVNADGTFAFDGTGVVSLVTIHFTISGKLTAPGSAAGSFRFVDVVSNEPPYRGAHCYTADVPWNVVG